MIARSGTAYLDFGVDLVKEEDNKAAAAAADCSRHSEEEEVLDGSSHLAADFCNPFQI